MSKKNPDLRGSMVALVTPFRNGKVDRKAMKGLIDFQIKSGTDVLVPCGTTGESATLSHEEHRDTLSFVVDYVDGRVPVIAGCGSNNTAEALGLVRHARKIGASAALIVTPYYNRPTQEGLIGITNFLLLGWTFRSSFTMFPGERVCLSHRKPSRAFQKLTQLWRLKRRAEAWIRPIRSCNFVT